MRIVFFIGHDGFLRNFGSTVRGLAERGHDVHLAMHGRRPELMNGVATAEAFAAEYPSLTFDLSPRGADGPDAAFTESAQQARDYWFYTAPRFSKSRTLRARAERQAPPRLQRLGDGRLARAKPVRAGVDAALKSVIAHAPPSPELTAYLEAHDPDVVLFTPLIYFKSVQYNALRASRSLRIPTGFLVHSWDNLSTKGVLHAPVDRVFVWNEAQRHEAVEMHGLDPDAVEVTGAQNFDHWFDWEPKRTRSEFCARIGLSGDVPFLLYLCSSKFIAREERAYVESWLSRLRESEHESLRSIGVVIRPHPQWTRPWEGTEALEPGRAVIWPRDGSLPVDEESRSDFYDSLSHAAAVVGINTSALIEAAIAGRQTFTWLTAENRDTQEGTIHFDHLAGSDGDGPLVVAKSFSEHAGHLAHVVATGGAGATGRTREFLERFVRPHGLDRPATPILVDAIERLAEIRPGGPGGTGGRYVSRALRRIGKPLAHTLSEP